MEEVGPPKSDGGGCGGCGGLDVFKFLSGFPRDEESSSDEFPLDGIPPDGSPQGGIPQDDVSPDDVSPNDDSLDDFSLDDLPLDEIHDKLMDMLFVTKKISAVIFYRDIKEKKFIRSVLVEALPQYPIADWNFKVLKRVFEKFKADACKKMEENEAECEEYTKRSIEAKRAANKKQLIKSYVAFQEKQKSDGHRAAILEHVSKSQDKSEEVAGYVRECLGGYTAPPAGTQTEKTNGIGARTMPDSTMADSDSGMNWSPSFASLENGNTTSEGNLGGGEGTPERTDSGFGVPEKVAREKLGKLPPQGVIPKLDRHLADVYPAQTIPKPEESAADASRETLGDDTRPSQVSKRKASLVETNGSPTAKRPKTKIVKKGIARVVKKGRC